MCFPMLKSLEIVNDDNHLRVRLDLDVNSHSQVSKEHRKRVGKKRGDA